MPLKLRKAETIMAGSFIGPSS